MRLFLSSFRVRDEAPELVELVGRDACVAVIANALDNLPDFPWQRWMHEERTLLGRSGLTSVELDLRDYYGQPDALLVERLAHGSLAYGGYSAGACVCGPTLRGIELVDDAAAVPQPVWDGLRARREIIYGPLGLVDFSVAPHYRAEDEAGEAVERVMDYFRVNQMPYRALRDGQALVIRDGSERLVRA